MEGESTFRRVLSANATNLWHETFTSESALSVAQVRSAGLWVFNWRPLQCPSNEARPLALVYLFDPSRTIRQSTKGMQPQQVCAVYK